MFGCPSVQGNGSCASICGRYDTKSALQHVLDVQVSGEINLPLVFPDTTTRNRPYSVFWLPKRLGKWGFRWFYGHYDTISGLQRILADQTSVDMALPLVFPDTKTRNRTYSVFQLSKRPEKWPFHWFLRTLRHEIGPTAYSGCPSVRGHESSAGFAGHYDTKSGLKHVIAVEASGEMVFPLVFTDITTRNRPYSVFWLSKCPVKWPFCWFSRTLRHEIGPTAYSG